MPTSCGRYYFWALPGRLDEFDVLLEQLMDDLADL
jgi:hypothetical protein